MALIHWFALHAMLFTILVTAGVALLLCCCLGCSNCSRSKSDDIFTHHEV